MTPLCTVYDQSPRLIEWICTTLVPIEETTFRYFRSIKDLIRVVDAAEAGTIPLFVAESAIRQHNARTQLDVSYEDILTRQTRHLFEDCGTRTLFVSEDEQDLTVFGDEEDFYKASDLQTLSWSIIWYAESGIFAVYKSPFIRPKPVVIHDGTTYAAGAEPTRSRDVQLAYVLPPEIEAALIHY